MSIQPDLFNSPGDRSGVAGAIGDLQRSMDAVERARTFIGTGTISGGSGGQIVASSITSSEILAGTITALQIAAGTITASQIAAATITGSRIAAGTITATNIASATITATQIAANTITAGQIAASTITGSQIAAGTITASNIAASTITGSLIAAGTITGTLVASATLDATKINVSNLAAISADLGSITAGTITGGVFRSSAGTARTQMDSTGIFAKDTSNVDTFRIDAATGNVTLKGTLSTGSTVDASAITSGTLGAARIPLIGGGNVVCNSNFGNGALSYTRGGLIYGQVNNAGTYNFTALAANNRPSATATYSADTATASTLHSLNPQEASDYFGAAAGQVWTFSYWVQGITDSTGTAVARILFLDASNGILAQTDSSAVTATSGTWTRVTVTATGPSGTAKVRGGVRVQSSATTQVRITALQLELGAVPTAYAPRADEILPNTIATSMVQAGAITASNVAADTLTANEIAANAITSSELASNSVTAAKIVANTITAAQIAASTITANEIAASTITGAKIAATTIAAGNIAAGTITATQLAADSVTTTQILSNTIVAGDIASATITGTQIAGTTITAGNIASGTITASQIASGTITAGQIATGTITATQIASGTITATQLTVTIPGRNFVVNSGFEKAGGGGLPTNWTWTSTGSNGFGSTTTAANVWGGARSGSLTITSNNDAEVTSDAFAVLPSTKYSISFYVLAATTASSIQASIQWLTSSGTWITTVAGTLTATTVGAWMRYTWTGSSAPVSSSNAGQAKVSITVPAGTSGNVFYIDGVQVEQGDVLTTWKQNIDPTVIDGSTITGGLIQTALSGARVAIEGSANRLAIYDSGGTAGATLDGTNGLRITQGTSALNGIEFLFSGSPKLLMGALGTAAGPAMFLMADRNGVSFSSNGPFIQVADDATDAGCVVVLQANNAAHTAAKGKIIARGDGSVACSYDGGVHNTTLTDSTGAMAVAGNISAAGTWYFDNGGAGFRYDGASSGNVLYAMQSGGSRHSFMDEDWGLRIWNDSGAWSHTIRTCIVGTSSGGTSTATGWGYYTAGWGVWSDPKSKSHAIHLDSEGSSLNKLRLLKPKKYWKRLHTHNDPLIEGAHPTETREEVGFLADEIGAVFPDLVHTWEPTAHHPEGMKWVDGGLQLSARIVHAVQELADTVDALKTRIRILESALS